MPTVTTDPKMARSWHQTCDDLKKTLSFGESRSRGCATAPWRSRTPRLRT